MQTLSIDQQVALLMQGTEYGDDSLKAAMAKELHDRLLEAEQEGRSLRVYCGFDPRTSDLHIGHMVPIRKLRQFQELGHDVTFLIGRFTSLVGDPSDKDKVRAQLSLEEATRNAETYADQGFKILDPDRTRIEYNDTWLSKLTFADLITLASSFTIQQFLSREAFRKRFSADDPIYLHELLYAIMQAYDAFHLRTDVQVGGSDQLFNIITAGRKLMEALGARPNIGIILGILPGTDGSIKMSKSLGNHIPLDTTPEDMYGKVMSVPDSAMGVYFRLATRWTPDEIEEAETGLSSKELHPRDAKMRLAREIVAVYHGEGAARAAEEAFRRVFQEQGEPRDMPSLPLPGARPILEVIVDAEMAPSRTQARRLIEQGAVRVDDELVTDHAYVLEPDRLSSKILRVGKRNFRRIPPLAD